MPQCTEINRGLAIRLIANEMQNDKFSIQVFSDVVYVSCTHSVLMS